MSLWTKEEAYCVSEAIDLETSRNSLIQKLQSVSEYSSDNKNHLAEYYERAIKDILHTHKTSTDVIFKIWAKKHDIKLEHAWDHMQKHLGIKE